MKRFLSSDGGAISLIVLILVVMLVTAATGQNAERVEPVTPAPALPTLVEIVSEPELPTNIPSPVVMYAIQDLNLRAAPGPDQDKITVLSQGTQVELLGDSQAVDGGTWVHVRADGYEGWVNKRFLRE